MDLKAVHPHGCGERISSAEYMTPICGSSPRVWGTLINQIAIYPAPRFIPTGVGNATQNWLQELPLSVHPHGCGERSPFPFDEKSTCGSSPRVWGTRGKFVAKCNESTVHPHGCGERGPTSTVTANLPGSSPRVWGTLSVRV